MLKRSFESAKKKTTQRELAHEHLAHLLSSGLNRETIKDMGCYTEQNRPLDLNLEHYQGTLLAFPIPASFQISSVTD